MPLNLFYTMVQKIQKWPKTQIKGGPALMRNFTWIIKVHSSYKFLVLSLPLTWATLYGYFLFSKMCSFQGHQNSSILTYRNIVNMVIDWKSIKGWFLNFPRVLPLGIFKMRCCWRQNQFQARLLILETLTYFWTCRVRLDEQRNETANTAWEAGRVEVIRRNPGWPKLPPGNRWKWC